jgi:hypothetical protein
MDGIWPFRLTRRADAAAVPLDEDFAPLFNFLTQPARVFEEAPPAASPEAPAAPALRAPAARPNVAPRRAPAAAAASGVLRRLRSAQTALRQARAARLNAKSDAEVERIRVWIDLDELAYSVVRADGRSPNAADAADWLLRLNFLYDGEAWCGDRDDLRLLGNVGVLKVRKGE